MKKLSKCLDAIAAVAVILFCLMLCAMIVLYVGISVSLLAALIIKG